MENRGEALQSLIQCLRQLKDRDAEKKRVTELLEVASKIGRPVLMRTALGHACRLAADEGNHSALATHLAAWMKLPDASENEFEELRKAVGKLPADVLGALPEDLRLLVQT
jgi:hypothetical protein